MVVLRWQCGGVCVAEQDLVLPDPGAPGGARAGELPGGFRCGTSGLHPTCGGFVCGGFLLSLPSALLKI